MEEDLRFAYVAEVGGFRGDPLVQISYDPKSLQKPFGPPESARRPAPRPAAAEEFGHRDPERQGLPRGLDLLPPGEPHTSENLEKLLQLNSRRVRVLRELREEARAAELEAETRRQTQAPQLYLGDNGVVGPGFSLGLAFDRYECTSPNPARVEKPHGLFEQMPADRIARKQLLGVRPAAVGGLPALTGGEPLPEVPDGSDERAVLEWLWSEAKPDHEGCVGKGALVRFLALHAEVREAFLIGAEDYQRLVNTMVTQKPGRLCFEEFEVR